MSSFKDRESLENIDWLRFRSWLDNGNWEYHRFRYPKDLTEKEIDDPEILQAFKKVDFDHDGIMSRAGFESYLFDLKYKSRLAFLGIVNQGDYDAYYTLNKVIPFLLVVYVKETDSLYFHLVRDPKQEPKLKPEWDDRPKKLGGQKYIYHIPHDEYCHISESELQNNFKIPMSQVDYYTICRFIIENLICNNKNTQYPKKPLSEIKEEIILEFANGILPRNPWQHPEVPVLPLPLCIRISDSDEPKDSTALGQSKKAKHRSK